MGTVFWADAAIAASAFLVVLAFPHVEIAPARAAGEAASGAPPPEG
jgi:hypothetical protein